MCRQAQLQCRLCGAGGPFALQRLESYADRSVTFDLIRCGVCGVVFNHPRPDPRELAARSGEYQETMRDMVNRVQRSWVGRLGLRLMRDARTPPNVPGGVLLDIGCSSGTFLARLAERGWRGAGIEFDPEAADQVRSRAPGIAVHTGRAEDRLPELGDAAFDLVTMWHVLEHLDDPCLVLSNVLRVLKPGGRLMIEVPNYGSLWSKLLRGDWFPLEHPFHQFHFNSSSLGALLERCGFSDVRVTGQPAPAEATWSLHMRWLGLTRRCWNGRLLWTPAGVAALYPLEFALAACGRANHMRAEAVKPAI